MESRTDNACCVRKGGHKYFPTFFGRNRRFLLTSDVQTFCIFYGSWQPTVRMKNAFQ